MARCDQSRECLGWLYDSRYKYCWLMLEIYSNVTDGVYQGGTCLGKFIEVRDSHLIVS